MTEIKRYKYKRIVPFLVLFVFCIYLTGCSGMKDENGSKKADDGRSYGGTIEGNMGDTINTAFFDFTVDQAFYQDTYQFEDGLYQADPGKIYLVVTLTLKNTYEKELPMSITDFTLDYEGNSEETGIIGYGKTELNQDEFMENVFTLKQGEQFTGSILFTVDHKDNYTLQYKEYYEDEFEGNQFLIHFVPKANTADSN